MGGCISHRGEKGSVCVLDISAVRANEDSDVRHDASVFVLRMMGSLLAGRPPSWKYEGRKCGR